ncbi:MAG: cation transporter [Clostridia bacterium]|nr:cation transporter [Clostridia bacterium]
MKYVFRMEDLECAHCAAKMEREISKLDGVISVNVSFLAQKMTLECDEENKPDIFSKAKAICKRIEPDCVLVER